MRSPVDVAMISPFPFACGRRRRRRRLSPQRSFSHSKGGEVRSHSHISVVVTRALTPATVVAAAGPRAGAAARLLLVILIFPSRTPLRYTHHHGGCLVVTSTDSGYGNIGTIR